MKHKKRPNILTNHPGQKESPTWKRVSTYVPKKRELLFADIRVALRVIFNYRHYDCIVLGAGRSDTYFGLIYSLLPLKRCPCIKIDCLWYKSENRFHAIIKRTIMRIIDKKIDRYVVWARHEITGYSREFGLPQKKFVFIPYHTTLDITNFQSKNEGYIFSGGNFARDYETLLKAVKGLPVKLLIASTRPELFHGIEIPENVEIKGFSHEEYIQKMAGCTINVVPLAPGLLHSGGQQTFLNSMYMGKPTIVNDPQGAKDYITNGKDGIIVKPSDHLALRKAIIELYNNPQKAETIGENARKKVLGYSTEQHFVQIAKLAMQLIYESKNKKKCDKVFPYA